MIRLLGTMKDPNGTFGVKWDDTGASFVMLPADGRTPSLVSSGMLFPDVPEPARTLLERAATDPESVAIYVITPALEENLRQVRRLLASGAVI